MPLEIDKTGNLTDASASAGTAAFVVGLDGIAAGIGRCGRPRLPSGFDRVEVP